MSELLYDVAVIVIAVILIYATLATGAWIMDKLTEDVI
jgi:hypothetical protein